MPLYVFTGYLRFSDCTIVHDRKMFHLTFEHCQLCTVIKYAEIKIAASKSVLKYIEVLVFN